MKTQGLNLTEKILKKILKDIERENKSLKEIGLKVPEDTKFLYPLVNKTGLSDGWEIDG